MTNSETKYNTLIGNLRNAKPVDRNSDLLTDEIMRSISLVHKNKAYLMFVWARPLMTAAAIFLLGLFFYQQVDSTNTLQEVTSAKYVILAPHYQPDCDADSTIKLPENRKLLNEYICYMKSNQAENEISKQFYLKYLPKNQEPIAQ